jgi:hypothetical protein
LNDEIIKKKYEFKKLAKEKKIVIKKIMIKFDKNNNHGG